MDGLTAVSWGQGRIDLFWVDDARALWHRAWNGTAWAEPESLGGTLSSSPAVTTWAANELEVFAVFPDGRLWDRYRDGAAWHDWESLGGDLDPGGQPASSSWGADRIDVFAPGRAGGEPCPSASLRDRRRRTQVRLEPGLRLRPDHVELAEVRRVMPATRYDHEPLGRRREGIHLA